MNEYTPNVERGAQLLTERLGPGWEERVNEELLDMNSCYECVLGQVYEQAEEKTHSWESGYACGMRLLFGTTSTGATPWIHAADYGFSIGAIDYETEMTEWRRLRHAWLEVLRPRVEALRREREQAQPHPDLVVVGTVSGV